VFKATEVPGFLEGCFLFSSVMSRIYTIIGKVMEEAC